jgi:release factor glutamine methyltransferase
MATTDAPPDLVARLREAGCVFAEDEARLLVAEGRTPAEVTALVDRRVAGEPLEQVLGWAEFAGLRITMAPGVFVPRRRSELLVQVASRYLARGHRGGERGAAPVVVDLCCGTGAIGVAVAVAAGPAGVELHASDIDPVAVACARDNLAAVGGQVHEGDLFDALPAKLLGRVDVLLANAPYVPTAAIALMPPEARLYEPAVALDGGTDGLVLHRRIAADARRWLAPGGQLLIETSRRQAAQTAEACADGGLVPQVEVSEELSGTVVLGRRRG